MSTEMMYIKKGSVQHEIIKNTGEVAEKKDRKYNAKYELWVTVGKV